MIQSSRLSSTLHPPMHDTETCWEPSSSAPNESDWEEVSKRKASCEISMVFVSDGFRLLVIRTLVLRGESSRFSVTVIEIDPSFAPDIGSIVTQSAVLVTVQPSMHSIVTVCCVGLMAG